MGISEFDIRSLKKRLKGDVFTDRFHRKLLATDAGIFQRIPSCVVYPASENDVMEALAFAKKAGISVHPRGAGSGLCGSALGTGMVIDFSRHMHRLIRLDEKEKTFCCEPGFRGGELNALLAKSRLFFPPDPSSAEFATFGGMYGTNASGSHSVKYGNMADYILDARVVLSDGTVLSLSEVSKTPYEKLPGSMRSLARLYTEHFERIETAYPDVICNTSGYNLRNLVRDKRIHLHRLFSGSEGTLGIVTQLTFRLIERPGHERLIVAFMPDITNAAGAVMGILPMGPSGIEIMDQSMLGLAVEYDPGLKRIIPEGIDNVLLIEFDGNDRWDCEEKTQQALDLLKQGKFTDKAWQVTSSEEKERIWAVRKAAVPILYKMKGKRKTVAIIEDAALPPERLPEYFRSIHEVMKRHGVRFVLTGHIAKGLMHTRPLLNLKDGNDLNLLKTIADEVFLVIRKLGGTVSGEHGDGRLRTPYIYRQYPAIHHLFYKTKKILDPNLCLNPEIITSNDPDLMKKHLRYGPDYPSLDLWKPNLVWENSVQTETETCHGCSKCTTVTTATRMCPIYKFTREEAASPKAKANLLRSILDGSISGKDLADPIFRYIINRCVNCGSCAMECPSNVNIPKLALEARAKIVETSGTSISDTLFANIETAGKYSGSFSEATSILFGNKTIAGLLERFSGIATEGKPVLFAKRPLSARIPGKTGNGRKSVLFFAGCYASYIAPGIGEAAVKILSALGWTVFFPKQHCCGLPALSKGMVDTARRKVTGNLKRWAKLLSDVDHIVVTCSSCGYALSEEWKFLLSGKTIRTIQEKIIPVSRLVMENNQRLNPGPKKIRIGYHMPCHLRLQPDPDASLAMLDLPDETLVRDLAGHCCGMAGSWGMASGNFPLSKTIGNDLVKRLLVEKTDICATDCPTCRIQMERLSSVPVLHPIEILADCLV